MRSGFDPEAYTGFLVSKIIDPLRQTSKVAQPGRVLPVRSVRVLVVEDNAFVRRGICALLCGDSTLDVVCETADGDEAIAKAQELLPDVVLLDIRLHGISGIEAARKIRGVAPESRIIFPESIRFNPDSRGSHANRSARVHREIRRWPGSFCEGYARWNEVNPS